jgi:hypothetical protein
MSYNWEYFCQVEIRKDGPLECELSCGMASCNRRQGDICRSSLSLVVASQLRMHRFRKTSTTYPDNKRRILGIDAWHRPGGKTKERVGFTRRPFIYTRHSKLHAWISARGHAPVLGGQLPTQPRHQVQSR